MASTKNQTLACDISKNLPFHENKCPCRNINIHGIIRADASAGAIHKYGTKNELLRIEEKILILGQIKL